MIESRALAAPLLFCFALVSLVEDRNRARCDEVSAKTKQSTFDPKRDEATLNSAGVATDGSGLLAYFKSKLLSTEDENKVDALIEKLGDDDFDVRQSASAALRSMGSAIELHLEKATGSKDPEVVRRAKKVLAKVRRNATSDIVSAAIRLLALRNPAGATQVLLRHVPLVKVDDDVVLDALLDAFTLLAVLESKPNPNLLEARRDKEPLKRALVVEALIRSGAIDVKAGKESLQDDSPLVRLHAALALVDREDREAVPALIRVLPELSLHRAWRAETILYQLAGDNSPEASLGVDKPSRIKARDAWSAWWTKHGARIDLAELKKRPRFLGLTLVAMRDVRGQGTVAELGRDAKPRWQINNLLYPIDAQVLRNGNVLIAERSGARVTERTRDGKTIWSFSTNSPTACYRMKSGETMIASYRELIVLDRAKKVGLRYASTRGSIYSARPLPKGGYVLLTSNRELVWLNAAGKQTKMIRVNGSVSYYGTLTVLDNGHVLVPLYSNHRVLEYDAKGKLIRTISSVQYPTSAQLLPNGRMLIGSYTSQKLYEVNVAGKILKTTSVPGRLWHTRRR